jgi:hypothetical protein
MKHYGLTDKALIQYKVNTRGNRNTNKKLARLKLSRNIAVSQKVSDTDTHAVFRYGYLNITVRKDANIIVDCHQEFMTEPCEPDHDGKDFIDDLYSLKEDDDV